MDDIVEREDIPLADRYELVQNIVATDMKRLFHLIKLENLVEQFHDLGNNMSRLVTAAPVAPDALLDIARHNTDTFTHMINVSAYCVLLAKSLGISDEAELKAIATGGLMHDIGKRFMPRRLLNKEHFVRRGGKAADSERIHKKATKNFAASKTSISAN